MNGNLGKFVTMQFMKKCQKIVPYQAFVIQYKGKTTGKKKILDNKYYI